MNPKYFKTLVALEEQPHIDHMMGAISESELKATYTSWQKITRDLVRL